MRRSEARRRNSGQTSDAAARTTGAARDTTAQNRRSVRWRGKRNAIDNRSLRSAQPITMTTDDVRQFALVSMLRDCGKFRSRDLCVRHEKITTREGSTAASIHTARCICHCNSN